MSAYPLRIVVAALVCGVSTNCFFVTDSCACSEPSRRAIVYGTVGDGSGPVAGVRVDVVANAPDPQPISDEVVVTSATGRYRLLIWETFPAGLASVRADPGTTSPLAEAGVEFTPRWTLGEPIDSVEVNVRLVPR